MRSYCHSHRPISLCSLVRDSMERSQLPKETPQAHMESISSVEQRYNMQLLRRLGHDRPLKQPTVWITTLVFGLFMPVPSPRSSSSVGRHWRLPWCCGGLSEASESAWGTTVSSPIAVTNAEVDGVRCYRLRYPGAGRRPDLGSAFIGCITRAQIDKAIHTRRRIGVFWSHIGWMLTGQVLHNDAAELARFVPELRKDKFHVWISRWHWVPIAVRAQFCSRWADRPIPVGYLPPNRCWPPFDLVRELCHAHVGIAQICDRRYLAKQLPC